MSLRRLPNWEISPTAMARFHLGATLLFLILIPPSMLFWGESVPYLVAISVWANFAGHLSAWQAARVEIKQDIAEAKGVSMDDLDGRSE